MKGGWRYGAGRPRRKNKTSEVLRIDVRRFQRDGLLDDLYSVRWVWPNGARIALQTSPTAITTTFRYRVRDDVWHEVDQRIAIDRTPCHFGGNRAWFVCPECAGRVAILYLWCAPRCRTCAALAYRSQSLDALDRSWLRTCKLKKRLAGGLDDWNFRRPKGMRASTYERLKVAYWKEEWFREDALDRFASRWADVLDSDAS